MTHPPATKAYVDRKVGEVQAQVGAIHEAYGRAMAGLPPRTECERDMAWALDHGSPREEQA